MKRIKICVRKNLNMSPGKTAAQAVHAAIGLADLCCYEIPPLDVAMMVPMSVVILEHSDKKYEEIKAEVAIAGWIFYEVCDAGITEVEPGTRTCFAFFEDDPNGEQPIEN